MNLDINLKVLNYFYLGAHISLMMPEEYKSVNIGVLNFVARKWQHRVITFEISGCSIWWHRDKTGAEMWLIGLNIVSDNICQLRSDLGLRDNAMYTPHMTILEYEM